METFNSLSITRRIASLATLGLVVLLGGCGRGPSVQVSLKFQAAQSAFNEAKNSADYLRSANLFQEVLDSGFESGVIYYNQGNAFMRAGQRGRAIAAYRQALRYRPQDPKLLANLAFAQGSDGQTAAKPLIEYILFWQAWWGYDTKFYLAFWSGLMTFAVAGCAIVWRIKPLRNIAWFSLALALILVGSAAYDWHRFDRTKRGVVVINQVTARKGDAQSYEPAFTQPLSEGTEFTVAGRREGWVLLRLSSNQEGWVPVDSVVVY